MKVKIIGFKVGVSRPTFNKTFQPEFYIDSGLDGQSIYNLGFIVDKALQKSDFLSIRKVD
jgi:hypothetical protein